jgi:hypothetical protein
MEQMMSETLWIVLMICVMVIVWALKDKLSSLVFKADKKGMNATIHAEPTAKVKITGVVQMKGSKMQVERDDVEITGIAQHGSTMNVKPPSQPRKTKK